VATKINGKCKGTNHVLKNFQPVPGIQGNLPALPASIRNSPWPDGIEPYMVIGVDITHNVGAREASIAAMVGSLDVYMTNYAHAAKVQPPEHQGGDGPRGGQGRGMRGREIIKARV
jgi:hypothetical protein